MMGSTTRTVLQGPVAGAGRRAQEQFLDAATRLPFKKDLNRAIDRKIGIELESQCKNPASKKVNYTEKGFVAPRMDAEAATQLHKERPGGDLSVHCCLAHAV